MSRKVHLAVAQMGPIQRSDTRKQVVARLCELMKDAAARGARWVTFPELTLTTFFPRWEIDDPEELHQYFEREMPGPDTQPLFDLSKRSEERRVGKECRSGWSPYHEQKR